MDSFHSIPLFIPSNLIMGKFQSRRVGKNSGTHFRVNTLQPEDWAFLSCRRPLEFPGKLDNNLPRLRSGHIERADCPESA
jgi:hypothetical protein